MRLTRETLKQHVRVTRNGCWIWKRARMGEGYGIFKLEGVVRYAHRAAYELFHGRIPAGGMACHHCDVKACVRPDHLYAGTNSTNQRDYHARHRRVAAAGRAA
jgi:hypothetical protein